MIRKCIVVLFLYSCLSAAPTVELGIDQLFEPLHLNSLKGKRVGLVTNHTGIDGEGKTSLSRILALKDCYRLVAIFAPEHGLTGLAHAGKHVDHTKIGTLPVYSLHGKHRRPTDGMLQGIDTLIYDIQEIGSRSYTYLATLCYLMEEAARHNIEVIVLDRPNPMGGTVVDGPMLESQLRSFVGYINIPYCHGMTIGELARLFNHEYHIGCRLKVIPMQGWEREMSFEDTGLTWIPTSPQIPEHDTPFYYPMTGFLGELSLANIGVGYTLPFKVIGAPWMDAEQLATALNQQKLPGVKFLPFHFTPFFGPYQHEACHGIRIVVTHKRLCHPVTVGYRIMGVLKSLYSREVSERIKTTPAAKRDMFHKVSGTRRIWTLFSQERYPGWAMAEIDAEERKEFLKKRKRFLLY